MVFFSASGFSTFKAEERKNVRVSGQCGTESGDGEEDAHPQEYFFASKALCGNSAEKGTYYSTPKRHRHDEEAVEDRRSVPEVFSGLIGT